MTIIKIEELIKNGVTYIVNTYDNGTVEQFAKPDPNAVPTEPEPELPQPVTNEQLRDELQAIKEESRINNEMSQSALAELLLLQAQQAEGVKGGE